MLRKSNIIFTLFMCLALTYVGVKSQSLNEKAQISVEAGFASLISKADSSFNIGDRVSSEQYLSQASEILAGHPELKNNLKGSLLKVKGKLETSLEVSLGYFNSAEALLVGNQAETASIKLFKGIAYFNAGDYRTAQSYFAESKSVFGANRDNENLAQVLNNEAVIAFMQGDALTANNLCRQALSINLAIGNTINASKNQANVSFFNGILTPESNSKKGETKDGNGGGSPTEVNTNGGGTVIVGNGGH
jgi:tetratricopeptide (TPR) repeat protein